MDKHIIAICGGGFGRNPGNGIIEQYILDQSNSKKPNICFIPTATGDDESYKVSYYATLSKLNCNPTHLDFFKRTPDLKKLINSQDIIFCGGGNTKSMLSVWRDWGLDEILRNSYENGTIMSGVSAGAICWFEKGVTDSWAENLKVMDCMGFTKGNCCPHYDEEPERKPSLHNFIKTKEVYNCYAIEGGCALHIKNDEVHSAISFRGKKKSYLVKQLNNKIIETKLSVKNII